jgi:hypothetical protein
MKTIAERVAIEQVDWIDDGMLEYLWSWKGPYNEDDAKLTGDREVLGPGGKPLRIHGHIDGKPLMPGAHMMRKTLTAFERRDPRPDLVVLAWDGDGDAERRRSGFEQARGGSPWPFPVILAMPEPESEAWFICGFEPRTPEERGRLDALTRELSFDPTKQPHRTTAHPNDASTDLRAHLRPCFTTRRS